MTNKKKKFPEAKKRFFRLKKDMFSGLLFAFFCLIFSTVMLQANKEVIGSKLNNYKSHNGHVVVRVYNKGADYVVYVLNDSTEKREVLQKFGAYESR